MLKEQQVIAHVQLVQEKEIIEKEREISSLNKILKTEREELFVKQKEIERLRGLQVQASFNNLLMIYLGCYNSVFFRLIQ